MAENSIGKLCFDDVRSMHLLAALSGGADSVALLHLLCRARNAYGLTITAAHFHHGIRGEDADRDAQFCRELCAELNVVLIEGHGDVPGFARERGLGLESAAREMRYDFLRRAMKEAGADRIALAHHLNDQAETILMHLLRGAGSGGICGMAKMQGALYRPLLEVSKAELVHFLEEMGADWREDATNLIDDNPRNALRLHVLPGIERSYPSAARAIARHGRIARMEDDCLRRMTDALLDAQAEYGAYGARLRLQGDEDEAILRRAVRSIIGEEIGFDKTDAIAALARQEKGRLEISGRWSAERTRHWLYFLPKGKEKPVPAELAIPGETMLEGVCRIAAELGDFGIDAQNPLWECMDADALEGAVLRLRRDGDRIHPLGGPGERLLSDCMIDKKIDRPLRDWLPVIARDSEILWAMGIGISHRARLHDNTRRRVRLNIIPITDKKAEVQYEE